jgi:hypothetical protein
MNATTYTPPVYTVFYSYGFLRVKRYDADRQGYTQIGSFAGDDAQANAEALIAADKAVMRAQTEAATA